jgi:serine protease Do
MAVLACLLAPAVASATVPEFPAAFGRACRSVVRVESTLDPSEAPVRMRQAETVFANSGFFVSRDGLVLTSVLGLAGCSELRVACADGRESPARVVAIDQGCGLALLSTDLTETVPLDPTEGEPAVDSWVLLAGPVPRDSGLEAVLIPGFVARVDAEVRLNGLFWADLIVATVNTRPGSAAAPLLDMEGRLMGVVIGAVPGGTSPIGGDCYALPVGRLMPVISQLREGKSKRLGWLGIAVARERGQDEGLRVKAVLGDSPGEAAGVRRGDVLLQIDDQPMEDVESMAGAIAEAGPGRRLELTILRDGELADLAVTTGARPILICGGLRRPGEKALRMRGPGAFGPFPPGAYAHLPEALAELLEENRRLHERLADLEGRTDRPAED